MRRRRGITIVEMLVTIALAGVILAAFAVLYRSAAVKVESGSATIFLTQTSRQVMDKITPYLGCALPASFDQADFIYSPTELNCSQQTSVYPNIYSLDFVSCADFLHPQFAEAPYAVPGYNNRRGTGPKYRYRVRFEPDTSQLLLEKLRADSPAPPTAPTLETGSSVRILARNLQRVTFERVGRGINVRVTARTTGKDGRPLEGLTGKDGRTEDPDDPNTPRHRQARQSELFTTVLIPYYTSR